MGGVPGTCRGWRVHLEHVGGGGVYLEHVGVGGAPGTCRGWRVHLEHVGSGGCTWNM